MPSTPEVPRKAASNSVEPTQIYAVVQAFNTLRLALVLGCVCFVAWMGRDVLVAMAGNDTKINIIADFFADIKFALSITLAGFAGLWAFMERRMRQKTVERLHRRVKELEQRIDPARSSSSLTASGKTNPNDLR